MNTTTEELNILMADASKDAVAFINEHFDRQVTLSQDDLDMVDNAITKLAIEHLQSPLNNEKIYTICSIMGAFVGEVFKDIVGGEWFMDESVPDAPFVVLNYAGKSFPFASICYEKLINDQSISVAKYYELALGGLTQ